LVENNKTDVKYLFDDNIEVRYDFTAGDLFVTYKNCLYSIFLNLISNSIKYRRKQVPSILEIRSQDLSDKIELTFKDNGMGIDLQKRGDQIFGLYRRFHANIDGKGMGLFMVKTLIEKLGGKITIESKVNEGTSFTIIFDK
jgi:signal transduction histidine kinase